MILAMLGWSATAAAQTGPPLNVGIQHLILAMPNVHDVNIIEELGRQVIPNVAHL